MALLGSARSHICELEVLVLGAGAANTKAEVEKSEVVRQHS
jgi:hypothetical protein